MEISNIKKKKEEEIDRVLFFLQNFITTPVNDR